MKLVVTNLSGARAGHMVFANINFSLDDGEALIITGSNGSGKSTLLRVIAGLLAAESGSVTAEGLSQDDQGLVAHELMHYLGHLNALKAALSVEENLLFWQQYCGSPEMDPAAALKEVALDGIGHLPAAYLSAGQKRRVSIARLLVSYKPIWVVDEPTAALDKASEQLFASLIEDHLAKGGIVLAATHQALGFGRTRGTNIKAMNLDEMSELYPSTYEHSL
jgi:heme exporter protein A